MSKKEIPVIIKIQNELKAPKGQFNKFGKYNYRSCEDILEGLKPLLEKYDAYINISDEIVQIGDRYYVKATASIMSGETGWASTAYAREAENKKGMDESQITGSASSYARKYALNGLLAIDDTKDADTQDNSKEVSKVSGKVVSRSDISKDNDFPASEKQMDFLKRIAKDKGFELNGYYSSSKASKIIKKYLDEKNKETEGVDKIH